STMAHTDSDSLQPSYLARVQQEISDFVYRRTQQPTADFALTETPLNIAETLGVWKLSDQAFETLRETNPPGDLVNWVTPTSLLYHQIRFNDQVIACARSLVDEAETQLLSHIG